MEEARRERSCCAECRSCSDRPGEYCCCCKLKGLEGGGEFEMPTNLMEKCDSPQIICLRENGKVSDNCRFESRDKNCLYPDVQPLLIYAQGADPMRSENDLISIQDTPWHLRQQAAQIRREEAGLNLQMQAWSPRWQLRENHLR